MTLRPPTRDLGAVLAQQLDKATAAASRITQAAKDAAGQVPNGSTGAASQPAVSKPLTAPRR